MYKVDRGIKNIDNVGRVISFNNKTEMSTWDGDECNRYRGTDSTIFPSDINKDDGLWLYEPDLCMPLGVRFDKVSSYNDVPTIRFGLDFGDVTANDELQCYCSEPPIGCPREGNLNCKRKLRQICSLFVRYRFSGTMNMFDCLDVPIVISLPHFYKADPTLLAHSQFVLDPNESRHSFYMDYEPV